MLKLLFITFELLSVYGQLIGAPPGGVSDQHGCILDGGYSWCESSQKCIRPWEEECYTETNTEFCLNSNIQMCRMACPEPECPEGQCAMRQGNCCDYMCIEPINDNNILCDENCPPPVPCPMPAVREGCRWTPPTFNNCGCSIGCGSLDCSQNNKVGVGGTCGGFVPYGMANICEDGLECVNTNDNMITDAPGTCQPHCDGIRDINGECLENVVQTIPWNCASWNDGCNTCSVSDGVVGACTLMMCFTRNEPYCSTYYSGDLRVGDLCYRFCEDGSRSKIDRRKDCPKGTMCVAENTEVITFDSCSNVMKCINIGH